VSLQNFTDANGNVDHVAAQDYLRRHYPELEGVNHANYQSDQTGQQGYRTNCGRATIAADASIRDGRTHPAPASTPTDQTTLETEFGSGMQPMSSYNQVTNALAHEPNGTRGSVYINHTGQSVGHAFLVHKDDRGVVNYVDAQNYRPADLGTNPSRIQYMRNNT
jgi:hypothetical protein